MPDRPRPRRAGNYARGKANARWQQDRMISSHGYELVRVGKDHPLANGHGYAYCHLVVWAASGRRKPRADQIIHHINGDKTDNRLTNLAVLSRAKHAKLHAAQQQRGADGCFRSEVANAA